MQLPQAFIEKIQKTLGTETEDFLKSMDEPAPVSVRVNPKKASSDTLFPGIAKSPVLWNAHGLYLSERPSFTFDPLLHAGCYYVQEASSMFVEHVFKNLVPADEPLRVLDLCAAPGGKSTLLLSLLKDDSLLIANEVIQSRIPMLCENIIRWGTPQVIVTNNDPKDFYMFENCFDVILVDAPCSGEGMFRKDAASVNEWSTEHVNICAARQQRILDEASKILKPGGLLIYSTCTFSAEEDEEQIQRLIEAKIFESVRIPISEDWGITETVSGSENNIYGYRFYPHHIKGEGLFISLLKKTEDASEGHWPKPNKKWDMPEKKQLENLRLWLKNPERFSVVEFNKNIYLFPVAIEQAMKGVLQSGLKIKLSGIHAGVFYRDEFSPEHPLALSGLVDDHIHHIALSEQEAIAYLQKKDIPLRAEMKKGWNLVRFQNKNIGWAKVLPNRINNAYPKEWRIRKEINS